MKRKTYNTTIEDYDIEMEINDDKSVYLRIESNDYNCYDLIIDYTFNDKKTLLKIVKEIEKKIIKKKKKVKIDV